ncbi:MAG: hypothetical protein QNJ46_01905 [Leptolyngbyaceae cyanobacterium MO_188.B28]|nr:hypothetical protein [Leptolyngbyaceae cyanobacterium MO_188.B28]
MAELPSQTFPLDSLSKIAFSGGCHVLRLFGVWRLLVIEQQK